MSDDDAFPMKTEGMSAKSKMLAGGGLAALIGAIAALVTAVHGSHSTQTTHDTSKDPVVINRPTDAHGSKEPIEVIQPSDGGRPIVIVGHGAPCPTVSPTATPTVTPSTPTSTPTSRPSPSCR